MKRGSMQIMSTRLLRGAGEPSEAVGCTVDGDQQAKSEMLVKMSLRREVIQ
jgi:hypothetical protein